MMLRPVAKCCWPFLFSKGGAGLAKGYHVPYGYRGWVESRKRYMLFATEIEYLEWIGDEHEEGTVQHEIRVEASPVST